MRFVPGGLAWRHPERVSKHGCDRACPQRSHGSRVTCRPSSRAAPDFVYWLKPLLTVSLFCTKRPREPHSPARKSFRPRWGSRYIGPCAERLPSGEVGTRPWQFTHARLHKCFELNPSRGGRERELRSATESGACRQWVSHSAQFSYALRRRTRIKCTQTVRAGRVKTTQGTTGRAFAPALQRRSYSL